MGPEPHLYPVRGGPLEDPLENRERRVLRGSEVQDDGCRDSDEGDFGAGIPAREQEPNRPDDRAGGEEEQGVGLPVQAGRLIPNGDFRDVEHEKFEGPS